MRTFGLLVNVIYSMFQKMSLNLSMSMSMSIGAGSPLSPSRQRPQTGPFAIPRIYP